MSSEATQSVGVYEVLAWLEANKKAIAIAFVATVVIGFGIAIYQWKSDQTELTASDELLKLKAAINSADAGAQPTSSAYLKVAEEYPGTAAADRALLLAAGALFSENKITEAQAHFGKFIQDRPQSPFSATAAYGVAACLESQGKLDEALAAYQNLSVRYPGAGVLEDAKLATARIYEAKKQPELALRTYDELVKSAAVGGMGNAVSEAMTRREDLVAKNPSLAKTNALPAVPSGIVTAVTNALTQAVKSATAVTPTNLAPAQR